MLRLSCKNSKSTDQQACHIRRWIPDPTCLLTMHASAGISSGSYIVTKINKNSVNNIIIQNHSFSKILIINSLVEENNPYHIEGS